MYVYIKTTFRLTHYTIEIEAPRLRFLLCVGEKCSARGRYFKWVSNGLPYYVLRTASTLSSPIITPLIFEMFQKIMGINCGFIV